MDSYSDTEQRSEAYRIMADFFISPPDPDMLDPIRDDFQLESGETADEIAAEFSELLAFPQGRLQPIATLFLGPAAEKTDYYGQAGLLIDEEVELPPDHLYLELLFFSHLVETGQVALQKTFLVNHLMQWVPAYCDELGRTARTAFYRGIAALVKEFIAAEAELYEE